MSDVKLPKDLPDIINLYKHQKKMNQVFIELLYIKCENCNKYVKKTRAINSEIVNYDFTFCGEKCYRDFSYRFSKAHKDIYSF